jgi:hypothetical protein
MAIDQLGLDRSARPILELFGTGWKILDQPYSVAPRSSFNFAQTFRGQRCKLIGPRASWRCRRCVRPRRFRQMFRWRLRVRCIWCAKGSPRVCEAAGVKFWSMSSIWILADCRGSPTRSLTSCSSIGIGRIRAARSSRSPQIGRGHWLRGGSLHRLFGGGDD